MNSPIDNNAAPGRSTLRGSSLAPLLLGVLLAVAACSDSAGAGSSGSEDDASDSDPSTTGAGASGNASSGNASSGAGNSSNTSTSGSSDSGSTGVGGGTGGAGGGAGGGTGGAGAGPTCDDGGPGEPANDAVDGAADLGTISDCDSDEATVDGVLAGASEEDWYVFTGTDLFGCVTDPTITVSPALQACMFFYCNEGDAAVSCPVGTTEATDGFGDPGCCGAESLAPAVNCEGSTSDSAWVYVQLQDASASCTPYSLTYHY